MDRVWAPWRIEYITTASNREAGCFLCIDPANDEQAMVVGRKGTALVVMNRYPYTNGHVMVVPVRHTGSIENLTDQELLDMNHLVQIMSAVFREEFRVDGINMGINLGRAAGAGLEEHMHIHMVPRWFGDTNFMAVTGETRVISEHIDQSYRKLKRRFLEKVS